MKEKFYANFAIVLPAAILVLILYVALGLQHGAAVEPRDFEWYKVLPYMLVLITALCGMNVMLVLVLGLISTGLVAVSSAMLSLMDWAGAMGKGMTGMGELIIVTLLAGGMLELIRYNGGLQYIITHLTARVSSRRGAELAIALMVALANFCTANNTVAIVTVGDISRRVAEKFGVPAKRAASILDTFSCIIQGIIPYGAQLLMGAALAGVSALDIIPNLFYIYALALSSILFIIFRK